MEEIPRDSARAVKCRRGHSRRVNRHQENGNQAGSGYDGCPDSHGGAEAEVVEERLYEKGAG